MTFLAVSCAPKMYKDMADKKENELIGGLPTLLRGIDVEGNSITPSLQEVAEVIPGERSYGNGMYYWLPKHVISLSKPDGGSITKTVTLFKIGENNSCHFNFFELFTMSDPSMNHSLPGWCKIHYASGGALQHDIAHTEYGCFSNLRGVNYDGEEYFGIDVYVNQYGGHKLCLIGFHEDISQIMDITGNFTEIEL